MGTRVTLIPGDGIGPEVTRAAQLVAEATGVSIDWEVVERGEAAIKATGTPLPPAVFDSVRKNRLALKGPITTPIGGGFRSVNVALRQELDLYASVRPARSIAGEGTRFPETDLIVVREATEGLYSGVEHWVDREHSAAETVNVITRKASDRICKFGFELARREHRRHVTGVHKANIMKTTGALFQTAFREMAAKYSGHHGRRALDRQHVHAARQEARGVRRHHHDQPHGRHPVRPVRGLAGGLGVAPGALYGDTLAVFEPVHGSAPEYRRPGQGRPGRRDPLPRTPSSSHRPAGGGRPRLPGRMGDHRREEGRHLRPRPTGVHQRTRSRPPPVPRWRGRSPERFPSSTFRNRCPGPSPHAPIDAALIT